MPEPAASPHAFESRCLAVLDSYVLRDSAARVASREYAGWLDRVTEVDGVAGAELSSIHGWLIAQGLLRFEFNGRNVGLQYQVSPFGRDALQRQSLSAGDEFRANESAA